MYFPLYCKSNASFLEGASHPEELVEEAHRIGLGGIALTDRNGLYGAVRAHVAAREFAVRLVLGAEVLVRSGEDGPREDPGTIVLLARNQAGYRNLCRLLTRGLRRGPGISPEIGSEEDASAAFPQETDEPRPGPPQQGSSSVTWREIAAHAEGLHALWGGGVSALRSEDAEVDQPAQLLLEAFGDHLHFLLTRHRRDSEVPEEALLRERSGRYRIPVAAAIEVLYHRPGRRELQDVLTAIRHRVPLTEAGRRLKPNAEHALASPARFAELFADDPAAVAETLGIADGCRFSLDELRYRYPAEDLPGGPDSAARLRELTLAGAARRYPDGVPQEVRRQLEKELALIRELDYGGYFLTTAEIVRFCREREILCQGRGSAVNSAVCFCLGITAVDPVRTNLLFERFLSRERSEPPDIDLDIMHARREEVIQFVYRRYGRDRAAMVANTVCYRARSAIRDVGRALGFPERSLDRLARSAGRREALTNERLLAAGWSAENAMVRHLVRLVNEIQGFPRHLSIHPGGFLLGAEPVSHIVPIENAAMEGRTVIQWNKDDIEELGLFKLDLLGLGALTQLDLCFRLLRKSRGLDLSLADLPADDPETFAMIRRGATVGVFQIESRAQMAMLPRLEPRNYYDLVIEVSIVRPGPISGGMVHPYLRRRRGEEPVDYPHPSLRPVLERTLGIPLFQEQVMRLAVIAADYTPGEANQLRRDMAAWRRTGGMDRHRMRLLSRMRQKGIPAEFAERVFRQIQGFGEYGFPEGHAASFALISYAGAYLLRHYPAEFVCALLNAQPMGFYSPATIIEDARRRGVCFSPVDAAVSDWDCSLEATSRIRMGLRQVKGLGAGDGERILAARRTSPFSSVADLARRTGLGRKALAALAEAGALDRLWRKSLVRRRGAKRRRGGVRGGSSLPAKDGGTDRASDSGRHPVGKAPRIHPDDGVPHLFEDGFPCGAPYPQAVESLEPGGRREALWEALGRATEDAPLLEEETPRFTPLDEFESIAWDHRTTGSSTRGHLLKPLRRRIAAAGLPTAREVTALGNGARARYAGVVICRQRPGTASGVVFMTLEDETGFVNLILWPDVFERQRQLARTLSFLGAAGRIRSGSGASHLVVEHLFRPKIQRASTPEPLPSRDFR